MTKKSFLKTVVRFGIIKEDKIVILKRLLRKGDIIFIDKQDNIIGFSKKDLNYDYMPTNTLEKDGTYILKEIGIWFKQDDKLKLGWFESEELKEIFKEDISKIFDTLDN